MKITRYKEEQKTSYRVSAFISLKTQSFLTRSQPAFFPFGTFFGTHQVVQFKKNEETKFFFLLLRPLIWTKLLRFLVSLFPKTILGHRESTPRKPRIQTNKNSLLIT